jgi:L-ascorbate metabolism protein UlaG (beta-lactamase superfamily)
MELEYFGANCVKITTKKASLVVDDNLEQLGLKGITKPRDIAVYTSATEGTNPGAYFTIAAPGEYEVSDVSIQGIAARAHMDQEGTKNAVIYRFVIDDVRVAVVGHIYPELSDEQLEALGMIDILFVPIGGNGYTLDGIGALKVIKKIEPKIVIPTHYADSQVKYEVPQTELEEAIKNLGMEVHETHDRFKFKSGELSEGMKLVVLKRQ